MGKGGKLFLKFKKRFWSENLGMTYIRNDIGFVWDCSFIRNKNEYILCCLVSGETGTNMNDECK